MIEILLLLVFIIILSLGGYFIAQQITKEIPFEEAIADQRGLAKQLLREKSYKKIQSKNLIKKPKIKKEEKPIKQIKLTKKNPTTEYEIEREYYMIAQEEAEIGNAAFLAENYESLKEELKKRQLPESLPPSERISSDNQKQGSSVQKEKKPTTPKKVPQVNQQPQEIIDLDSQLKSKSLNSKKAKSKKPDLVQIQQPEIEAPQDALPNKSSPEEIASVESSPKLTVTKPNQPKLRNAEQPTKKSGSKKQTNRAAQSQEVLEDVVQISEQKNILKDKIDQNKRVEEEKTKLLSENASTKQSEKVQDDHQSKLQRPPQAGHPKKSAKKKDDEIADSIKKATNNKNLKKDSKSSSSKVLVGETAAKSPDQSPVASKHKKIEESEQPGNMEEEQMRVIALQTQMVSLDKRKKERKEDRKDTKEKFRASLSEDDLSRLIPLIQKAKLNSTEIQEVVEMLLNKQQQRVNTGNEWVEKGKIDPLSNLKKQLEEAEARLKEHSDIQSGLSTKIMSLRADLNGEKAKSLSLKKKLDSSSALYEQKLNEANLAKSEQTKLKLNELHITLEQSFQEKLIQHQQAAKIELEKAHQHYASVQSEYENQLQQYGLAQANVEKEIQSAHSNSTELEQQKQQLQAAFADTQNQFQKATKEREELVQTCQQYQQHLSSLKDKMTQQENSFNTQLTELKSKLSIAETARTQSLTQYSQSIAEREQLLQKLNQLEEVASQFSQNQSLLQNEVREKTEIEGRLHLSENELSSVREVVKNQIEQIERLKEEKESLASQSVRPAAEGQENGDVHVEHVQEPLINQHTNMYEEKLSSLTKEITRLKDDLSLQRKKNDEQSEKWETQTNDIKSLAKRLFPESVVGETWDQAAFLAQVKTALDKKPEVIEKITEKIVEDPKLKKVVSDLQKENSTLLMKIENLEKEKAVLELSKEKRPSTSPIPVPAPPPPSPANTFSEETKLRLSKLEEENKGLNEKVSHYQEVLGNTESLLKSLQVSVENEESIWQGKLSQSDKCVKELRQENNRLSCEMTDLQSSLDQFKQAEELERQLTSLKDKLCKEESERKALESKLQKEEQSKVVLQEQLITAQEQIKLAAPAVSQVVPNANGPANGLEEQEAGALQCD